MDSVISRGLGMATALLLLPDRQSPLPIRLVGRGENRHGRYLVAKLQRARQRNK